jgi:hypothetical protein
VKIELVYIGQHPSRFIYGGVYQSIWITEESTTIVDKDGVPMEFSNDILHLHFRQKDKWRDEQIEKILE